MQTLKSLSVYPRVCCRWVEELADDVCGGSYAEEDGTQNLLPPRQQQHRVFPSHLWAFSIFFQQNTHCSLVTPVSVTRTVWKVVSIIYNKKQKKGDKKGESQTVNPSVQMAWRTLVLTVRVLQYWESSIAVLLMREFIIIQTFIKLFRAHQDWSTGRGV